MVTEVEAELIVGDGMSIELNIKIDLEKTDAQRLELDRRYGAGKKTVV